ncbi:MAG: hypothetical protein IH624_02760 [Phycisphaerae bacterium]|nr:hypothetical protein [Phycisphaerae bacterium]
MNTHVDDHVAFDYPEDYLLESCYPGYYSLKHASRFIFVRTPDSEAWELFKMQQDHALKAEEPPARPFKKAPTQSISVYPYVAHGFSGEAFWWELISPQNKLLLKGVNLHAKRGPNYLHLRVDDKRDFSQEVLDTFLRTLFFPGEDGYTARARTGPKTHIADSPYIVRLPRFASRKGRKETPSMFSVEYGGQSITPAQKQAVETLITEEESMYAKALDAVFHYYTNCVRLTLEQAGLCQGPTAKLFPKLKRPSQMAARFTLLSIRVHEPRDDGIAPLALHCDCTWDPEHGLGIRLKGAQIETVGTDEVAIFRDHYEQQ